MSLPNTGGQQKLGIEFRALQAADRRALQGLTGDNAGMPKPADTIETLYRVR